MYYISISIHSQICVYTPLASEFLVWTVVVIRVLTIESDKSEAYFNQANKDIDPLCFCVRE